MILLLPILVFFVFWIVCFGGLMLLGWWIYKPTNRPEGWWRGEIVAAAAVSALVAMGCFAILYGGD